MTHNGSELSAVLSCLFSFIFPSLSFSVFFLCLRVVCACWCGVACCVAVCCGCVCVVCVVCVCVVCRVSCVVCRVSCVVCCVMWVVGCVWKGGSTLSAVSLRRAGVKQLYQEKRMIGGIGNVLFSTWVRSKRFLLVNL